MSDIFSSLDEDKIRQEVRKQYAKILTLKEFGMLDGGACSCAHTDTLLAYSAEDRAKVPPYANLGLGCANPKLYVDYKKGETVLDLGCGAGFDCFLAMHEVGSEGRVIGVDMMWEMISKARELAFDYSYTNVEFRLGEIEYLPVENKSIDVVISNCVLNLSPNKRQVIKECKRVMKENARLYFFDIVYADSITDKHIKILEKTKLSSCMKQALTISQMRDILEEEGFKNIVIEVHPQSKEILESFTEKTLHELSNVMYSAIIKAFK